MQATVLRRVGSGSGTVTHAWLLPFLILTALLQSLAAASLGVLALSVAASQSDTVQDILGVATALAGALLSVGLRILNLA